MFGLKSPQCSKRNFPPIPHGESFIQILHVHNNHWVTVSNIDIKENTLYRNAICIYDSATSPRISTSMKEVICQFVKPKTEYLLFDTMNIQAQPNLNDCGLYAIACATEITHGHDPVLCAFNNAAMRSHLISCLETGYIERFPCKKIRRVPFGSRV